MTTRAVCVHCDGLGYVMESIDDERLPVSVPCQWCRAYCKPCDKWVPKKGHECKGEPHGN